MNRWTGAYGVLLTSVAVGTSLLAFTVRLALTQFYQQQEIGQREAAQAELFVANETIGALLEDSRLEAKSIAQINELGTLLQAAASREEALRDIPDRMALLFPGTSGKISILDATKNRAEAVTEWSCSYSIGSRTAVESGRDQNAATTSGNLNSKSGFLHWDGSSISIPLMAHGEVVGVLAMHDERPLAGSTVSPVNQRTGRQHLASAVAKQIALSISNLDLRDALRDQAIRDPLTGLYNRRYMQEFVEREVHRARRRQSPLAVMLLDLDYFKRYNDTYGHAAGDDALTFVAEVLLSSIRAEDVACRYGGEEFIILLPECSLQQAASRAEEIRARLKQLYGERPGELPQGVTASFGVAGFEHAADNIELLLKRADDALYEAKRAGRDRVVVAFPQPTPLEMTAHHV